ncbi:MAG: glycosyltransferase family 1 protein [Candidatus Omnitrophota bacterium]
MRIGIDAYPLTRVKAGIGYYTHNLIKHLLEIDTGNEYVLYHNIDDKISMRHPQLKYSTISGKSLWRYSTPWFLLKAKQDLLRDKIDVFWGTSSIVPVGLPRSIKVALTIYDLVVHFYSYTMENINYLVTKSFFSKSVLRADKIIAISHTTANDLENFYPGISDKSSVAYIGVDNGLFRVRNRTECLSRVCHKYSLKPDFMLFVGTIEPRKNLISLIRAFKILKSKYAVPHQLVIAGGTGWKQSSILKEISAKKEDVRFINYVPELDLAELYSSAGLFVMPSLYEGFGMPVVEAMASGTAVAISDIPIFREVAADAALFFDPRNPEDIAEKMHTLISNAGLRNSLAGKGIQRVQAFSWKESAKHLINIFNELHRDR